MRRLLSLVLLAAFGLPVVAPALALGQDPDAHLPACCRRNGAHHCMMNMAAMERPANGPSIGAVCPFFPQPAATPPVATLTGPALAARLGSPHAFAFAAMPHATTRCRLARERPHHKRGPPQDLL